MLSGFGQSFQQWPLENEVPVPPASGVRDNSGVFNRNTKALEQITAQLEKLRAEHGYRIYLIVEPVLISTSAPELAAKLQQSWLPDGGDGIVVVFEADTGRVGFGPDIGGGPDPEDDPVGRVPTHETAAILLKAGSAADRNLEPVPYIQALINELVSGFNDHFEKRMTPTPAGRSLRFALLTIGGVTILALAAIGIGAMVRLPSMARARTFKFPKVDRPERLGAPCGGGDVTVRRFRAKADGR